MNPSYSYLLINLGSLAVPLLLSFDSKVAFVKKWKAFWKANLITLAFFVVWDVIFTAQGVWGFNDTYLSGPELLGLPVEEWLFFICIPYACVFLYETFRTWIPGTPFSALGKPSTVLLFVLCLILMISFPERWYTFYTALFTAIGLFIVWKSKAAWVGWFVFSYLIILVPFIAANGLLTGLGFWQYPLFNTEVNAIDDMIVWYNNAHNLRIRIFSVPLDDFLYGFLLVGMNVGLYERFLGRYHEK